MSGERESDEWNSDDRNSDEWNSDDRNSDDRNSDDRNCISWQNSENRNPNIAI